MLIRLPDSWPYAVVATVAMVALALLDLAGSFVAKEAVERRSVSLGVLGAGLFVVLFWAYASSLQYAELGLVTVGWIMVVQVGVILLDRLRYGVDLSTGKWLAVVVILVAQTYLLLAPTPGQAPPAAGADGPTTQAAHLHG